MQEALGFWRGLDRAAQTNFRFHHISTDEVYGTLGPEGLFSEVHGVRAELALLRLQGFIGSFGSCLA